MESSVFDFTGISREQLPETPFAGIPVRKANAICTLVMNDVKYAIFAACLAQTLQEAGMLEVADIVFFVSDVEQSSMDLLSHYGSVLKVSKIKYAFDYKLTGRFYDNYKDWISTCYTKLYCFLLTQYEKVLFLDADMLCRSSFANIFELYPPFGYLAVPEKSGLPTGPVVDMQDMTRALLHGYGISGAFFCVVPSVAYFYSLLSDLDNKRARVFNVQIDGQPLNAGPDEVLLSMQIAPWRQVSKQFCCVPWLAHRFENGEFALDGPDNKYDGSLTNRRVYLTHYAAEKPWQSVEKARSQKKQIWEDVRVFFEAQERVKAATKAEKVAWLEAPQENEYYTRQQCDSIYDGDFRRKFDSAQARQGFQPDKGAHK